jgi:hypothetical protein
MIDHTIKLYCIVDLLLKATGRTESVFKKRAAG